MYNVKIILIVLKEDFDPISLVRYLLISELNNNNILKSRNSKITFREVNFLTCYLINELIFIFKPSFFLLLKNNSNFYLSYRLKIRWFNWWPGCYRRNQKFRNLTKNIYRLLGVDSRSRKSRTPLFIPNY